MQKYVTENEVANMPSRKLAAKTFFVREQLIKDELRKNERLAQIREKGIQGEEDVKTVIEEYGKANENSAKNPEYVMCYQELIQNRRDITSYFEVPQAQITLRNLTPKDMEYHILSSSTPPSDSREFAEQVLKASQPLEPDLK